MRVSDVCEQFLDHCEVVKGLSPLTLRAYTQDLAEFAEFSPITDSKPTCKGGRVESGHIRMWKGGDPLLPALLAEYAQAEGSQRQAPHRVPQGHVSMA